MIDSPCLLLRLCWKLERGINIRSISYWSLIISGLVTLNLLYGMARRFEGKKNWPRPGRTPEGHSTPDCLLCVHMGKPVWEAKQPPTFWNTGLRPDKALLYLGCSVPPCLLIESRWPACSPSAKTRQKLVSHWILNCNDREEVNFDQAYNTAWTMLRGCLDVSVKVYEGHHLSVPIRAVQGSYSDDQTFSLYEIDEWCWYQP